MDLGFLTAVYATPGPFATAYLDTTSAVEGAAERIAARWRARREELTEQGADEATLDAMAVAAGRDHGAGDGQVLVGGCGRLLFDARLPAPPRRETASWGPLPDVVPLVAQLGDTVPYVLVVADRAGADITAYGDSGDPEAELQVEGGTHQIRKLNPGGWSQRRYQERAENPWQTNAERVAEQVARLAAGIGAKVIVAAGDVRALGYLRDSLPPPARELLTEVDEGGRVAGAAAASLAEHAGRLVAEVAVRENLAVIEEFEQERGQHDRAVEGLANTVGALRRAQVQAVVASGEFGAGTTLYVGTDPLLLGLDRQELVDLGADLVVAAPAGDAILRAAAATGAELVFLPGPMELADGVGALLRYADAATPA